MIYFWFILIGYLSGSVLYAYLLPRLFCHVDVTEAQDENPGAANAFMRAGVPMGVLVLLLDLLKAAVPVYFAARLADPAAPLFALVLAAPVVGHAFPFWRKGRGGKAIAASFGALLGLLPDWRPVLVLAGFYLLFSLVVVIRPHLFRSVAAFSCFCITCFLWADTRIYALGCLAIAAVVVWKHLASYHGERVSIQPAFRR